MGCEGWRSHAGGTVEVYVHLERTRLVARRDRPQRVLRRPRRGLRRRRWVEAPQARRLLGRRSGMFFLERQGTVRAPPLRGLRRGRRGGLWLARGNRAEPPGGGGGTAHRGAAWRMSWVAGWGCVRWNRLKRWWRELAASAVAACARRVKQATQGVTHCIDARCRPCREEDRGADRPWVDG